jgi:hypothetical protein
MYLIDLVHFKNNRHFFSIIIKLNTIGMEKKLFLQKI